MERKKRYLVLKQIARLSFLLALATLARAGTADSVGAIDARITKLHNDRGQVICILYTPSDKFPDQSHNGMTIVVPIQNRRATCHFRHLAYGDYAIVAFHDENHDGKFNQNFLGMPKEGFGFSDNPGTLKKPTFKDSKFTLDQPVIEVAIGLNYWF